MRNAKKVILFIVEGPTDENALSPVLKPFFQSAQLHFHVVHGDITTNASIQSANAPKAVTKLVTAFLSRYHLQRSDLLRIVHVIDTDGAFIPDEAVLYSDTRKIQYEQDCILSAHPDKIIQRNHTKRGIVERLMAVKNILRTPYQIYYFSHNMEHVLHDEADDCSSGKKVHLADEFADRYEDDPAAFRAFISSPSFAVSGTYADTWVFILQETHSLARHSNLHLLLP